MKHLPGRDGADLQVRQHKEFVGRSRLFSIDVSTHGPPITGNDSYGTDLKIYVASLSCLHIVSAKTGIQKITVHGHSAKEIAAHLGAPPRRGVLRDAIYGTIDGAVTPFAIVAGVAGAGLASCLIVALCAANVLAEGSSMAAANYSGTKAKLENMRRIRAIEERRIDVHPDGEKREVRRNLFHIGLACEVLAQAVNKIKQCHENWISLIIERKYGLSGVDPHPMKSAIIKFTAFLAFAVVPLFPFLLGLDRAFTVSASVTLAVFFGIGAPKSHWSFDNWQWSGLETLVIGDGASGVACLIGTVFHA